MKELSIEQLKNFVQDCIAKRDADDNVKSDVVIHDTKDGFSVDLDSENMFVSTGIGGFKMFTNNYNNFDMLKITYNGVVLNKEQKQELYEETKDK